MEIGIKITVLRNVAPDSLAVGYQAFSGKCLLRFRGKSVLLLRSLQNFGTHLPVFMASHPRRYLPLVLGASSLYQCSEALKLVFPSTSWSSEPMCFFGSKQDATLK
jgi:hypothetical protein